MPGRIAVSSASDDDPFDLVEADGVAGSVVEFRRSGRLVAGDALGVLQPTAAVQVGGNPRGSKGVAAGRRR